MAFPVVEGRQTGQTGSNATSSTITFPAGIQNGELLLVVFSVDANEVMGISSGTGWAKAGEASEGSNVTGAVLWKIANGQTLCVPCHKATDTYGRTGIFRNVIAVAEEA